MVHRVGQPCSQSRSSFYYGNASYPGNYKLYKDVWPNAELVLFKSRHNIAFIHYLKYRILHRFNGSLNIKIGEPWHPVAITDQLADKWNHTLIEFNETVDRLKRKKIAKSVAYAILDTIDHIDGRSTFDMYVTKIAIITMVIILIIIVLVASSYQFLSRQSACTCPQVKISPMRKMSGPPLN